MRSVLRRMTLPFARSDLIGAVAVAAALFAWLWPIGLGGKMPVGGDVTQFFMGLMGFLSESLRAGRLPVWNDLWGYGFPGIGESQMGVFYPLHVLFYGHLATETAYVVSMVFHTLWGGLGTFWAARRFNISFAGSALAAFAWSASGFFLIHLAHQWGYTTGSWMPWAWGLTWCCLDSPTGAFRRSAPFLLSIVLALQILPGHFQLAFMTECGVVLLVAGTMFERWSRRFFLDTRADESASAGFRYGGAGQVLLALVAVFPLTAIQLWPTVRLAGLAEPRDFEYLSGFAATPFHLVNFVAPGFFHRSPLWRPLVWDPFHTSPEEQLAYIGLVPLCLAGMAIVRGWRHDAVVRVLAILLAVTLVLSLGPYVPGFRYLIKLPGFSFFRAPARWGLAASLLLALLAGKGFDGWAHWTRPGRSLGRFAFLALFWVLATLGVIELALLSSARPGWPTVARAFQRAFDAMPWTGDPTFATVMTDARRPAGDSRIPAGLNRSMFLRQDRQAGSFASERVAIYALELGELAALLAAIWVIGQLSDRRRLSTAGSRWMLIAVTFLDLWVLGRHRLLDVDSVRPLVEQSPVLARLAREPRGTRVASDKLKNMPMLVGQTPILAYRTLDLPAVGGLTSLTVAPLNAPAIAPLVHSALRATGTSLRIIDPIENRKDSMLGIKSQPHETIEDPALATWLFGASWVTDNGPWAKTFSIWSAPGQAVRAWMVPEDTIGAPDALSDWPGDPRELLAILDDAEPLATATPYPEEWLIAVESDEPAWVIVSQVADPQWTARWIGLDGQGEFEGEILPAFRKGTKPGAWQRLAVPASGRWTLQLEYEARDVAEGAAISLIAWLSLVVAAIAMAVWSFRSRPAIPEINQSEAQGDNESQGGDRRSVGIRGA